ncbi:transglutaminase-like domain-containing protein [Halovenus halobia]|uniref:transglutaminase-like domain-containing protein n=1 Tax=Halovenus halobia TaxID=3396622 RepID=UPI003F56301C
MFITDQRGLLVGTPLETNDTYTTITYGPPSRSEAKRATGTAPPSVQERYTQLPADTPGRLGERTDGITSDAETPYEAAEAVERWLEQNKQYSLDANHDRANDVATEFVFEMEAGYCQYFATAMTAMLRTQDIPARYVTGYTTGEQVAENTYLARGKNAHAWVEVYFEGVGWVSFDPTPGGGRVDAGRALEPPESQPEQNQSDPENDDTNQDEQNSEDDEQTESNEDNSEEEDLGPPYDIDLSPEPIPGAQVTVTVEKNGTAISGAEVLFNGEVVGTTNETGQLQATVPYALELVVSAEPPPSQGAVAQRPVGGTGPLAGNTLSAPVAPAQTDENSSVRYDIPTDASITTQNLPLPGRTVAANMSINGSAVAGLTVIIDGEQVGTTNETGAFSLPVPADVSLGEGLPIEFKRGEFAASGNITVADVEINVETGFFKLPGTSADITVTAVTEKQGIPLSGVPIRTNGAKATLATDESGSATMDLPWSNEATATAVVGEQTVTTAVSGILFHLGGVLAVLAGTLAGSGTWIYRNPEKLRQFKYRVVSALVTTGEWLRLLGHYVYSIGPALARGLRRFGVRARTYLARLRDEFTLAALLSPVTYVIARVTGFLAWLQTIPGLLRGLLSNGGSERANDDGAVSGPTETTESPDGTTEVPAYQRLRQCWRWLVRRVVRRSKTKTAVEVENQAVEKGFPRRPVRRLRRAFQDVEYGFTDPDDRVDVAEESVEQLREDTAEDEQ